jgi:hypothetical protein
VWFAVRSIEAVDDGDNHQSGELKNLNIVMRDMYGNNLYYYNKPENPHWAFLSGQVFGVGGENEQSYEQPLRTDKLNIIINAVEDDTSPQPDDVCLGQESIVTSQLTPGITHERKLTCIPSTTGSTLRLILSYGLKYEPGSGVII